VGPGRFLTPRFSRIASHAKAQARQQRRGTPAGVQPSSWRATKQEIRLSQEVEDLTIEKEAGHMVDEQVDIFRVPNKDGTLAIFPVGTASASVSRKQRAAAGGEKDVPTTQPAEGAGWCDQKVLAKSLKRPKSDRYCIWLVMWMHICLCIL